MLCLLRPSTLKTTPGYPFPSEASTGRWVWAGRAVGSGESERPRPFVLLVSRILSL